MLQKLLVYCKLLSLSCCYFYKNCLYIINKACFNDDNMYMKVLKNYFSFQKMFILLFSFAFVAEAYAQQKISARLTAEEKKMYEELIAGSPEQKQMAAMQCGLSRSGICVRQLVAYLESPDEKLRYQSVEALGKIANPIALPELLTMLEKTSEQDKQDQDIQKLQDDIAANALTSQELKPERQKVYQHIAFKAKLIFAIGALKNGESVAKIEPYIKDNSPIVRRATALALTNIATEPSLNALKGAHEGEKQDRVKAAILAGVLKLETSDSAVAKELFNLLFSNDWLARYDTAKYIEDLKLKEARTMLQKALIAEENEEVRIRLFYAYQMANNIAIE